jgi:hypothetical protein
LYYFDLSTGSSGNQPTYVGTNLTYNPNTNILSGSKLNITASLYGTSSYSTTASYALNGGGGGTTLTTGSTYPITSSYSNNVSGSVYIPSSSIFQLYDSGLGRFVQLTSNNGILSVQ